MVANVLADRYASPSMCEIWSQEGRIILERVLWIAVAKAQRELGMDIPEEALAAYEAAKGRVDLESIRRREEANRHDVKARLEEFCDLAGYEHLHKGMTSRDLTENVEQLQVFRSLNIVRDKVVAALARLAELAERYHGVLLTARTHNVAAQPTTFGKRLAMFGEELLVGYKHLEGLLQTYHIRGLKGAVGTALDQLTLFEGDVEKAQKLEKSVLRHLGVPSGWENVGQVYPRSHDFSVISALVEVSSAPSSFAKTLRLMAGHETASEGFAPGQTGSSAMPHKMNSRSCERLNGFHVLLKGYLTMASGLAGDQWNEGDVSCSVVRRVMLPDAFFACDGLFETFLTILGQLEVYPAVIEKENEHYLPFLSTTMILMEAVKAGLGREKAHALIKKHALATVRELREGEVSENNLLERLAGEGELPIELPKLQEILAQGHHATGLAERQIEGFRGAVAVLVAEYPEASRYVPEPIL